MKQKLLVLTSTFPRWKGDTNPPFVFELSRRLTDKFEVSVLTPHYPGSKEKETMEKMNIYRFRYFFKDFEKLAGSGGILPKLKANKWYYLTVPFLVIAEILATLKLVKKIKPKVIHAHWIIPQGIAAYINFLVNKTPYVVTSHGSDIFSLQNKLLIKVKNIILQNSKSVTVVGSAIKRELTKIDKKLITKTEVIPMGVDIKLFNPNKYDKSIKIKFGIKGKFLLFVGRLTEKKGIRYLIEAMPKIVEKYPKTKLLVIGSGPLEDDLKNLVSVLKLQKSVIFVGAIQNSKLPGYYATADIFVGPSTISNDGDREGLPVTYMEAIASGCPVVATKIASNQDIIDNYNGILIEEKNPKTITTGVLKLLKSKKMKERVVVSAKKFSWELIQKKYAKTINQ